MRKLFIVMATILALALLASGAWATPASPDFPNDTNIQAYHLTSPYTHVVDGNYSAPSAGAPTDGTWFDRIGAEATFESYGADINTTDSVLTIYTNWGPGDIGGLGAFTSDLFIDVDPGNDNGFDYAVDLTGLSNDDAAVDNANTVDIVSFTSVQTSQDLFAGTGNIYGGRYDDDSNKPVPVNATGTTKVGDATVTWTTSTGLGAYAIVIDLSDPALGFNPGDFAFVWGTGTCANDTVLGGPQPSGESPVPLPGALLLLGAGLVRLAAYRRRHRVA